MAFFSNTWGTYDAVVPTLHSSHNSEFGADFSTIWGTAQFQSPTNPQTKTDQQNLYKTELCRSFEETGSCKYGQKCQFAHGQDELRPIFRHPKYKTEECKTFASTGSCPYGKRCRFIHTPKQKQLDFSREETKLNLTPNNQPINFSTSWEPFNSSFGHSSILKPEIATAPQPISLGLGFVDDKSSEPFELVTPHESLSFSFPPVSSKTQPKRLSFFESFSRNQ